MKHPIEWYLDKIKRHEDNIDYKKAYIKVLYKDIGDSEKVIRRLKYQIFEATRQNKKEFDETKFCIPKRKS